jgi:hypothetical protein
MRYAHALLVSAQIIGMWAENLSASVGLIAPDRDGCSVLFLGFLFRA